MAQLAAVSPKDDKSETGEMTNFKCGLPRHLIAPRAGLGEGEQQPSAFQFEIWGAKIPLGFGGERTNLDLRSLDSGRKGFEIERRANEFVARIGATVARAAPLRREWDWFCWWCWQWR